MSEIQFGGHVFVVQGDLARLKTDAWFLPSDTNFNLVKSWIPPRWRESVQAPLAEARWESAEKRVLRFDQWPGASMPWLANVGSDQDHTIEWYLDAVTQFVREAAPWARERSNRKKPLLGVPAVGTGMGGKWEEKAAVLSALYSHLLKLVKEFDVDIVYTLYDAPSFAAAQYARERALESNGPIWDLPEELLKVAERLGERARRGELVIFMGSGVSVGAGLPTWNAFLRLLGERAGLSLEELDALESLDAMDAGSLLERRLGGRDNLKAIINEILDVPECSLQHTLLASTPHEAAVTLNYDTLYELAAERVVGKLAVLPHDRGLNAERWLLKLHGCIQRGRLVLSREDYLRFGERRTALAGIVQALLITKHMVFVGFGLRDANFLRILDDVRRSLGDTTSQKELESPIGTVLMVRPEPLRNALFDGDLDLYPMHVPNGKDVDIALAARRLELFLDAMLYHSATRSAFFFDKTFAALLNPSELGFRDELLELVERHQEGLRGNASFEKLLHLLKKSGLNDTRDA
ncbi:SIR2 family protein [Microvenator marinus]|uniref:SIR2 family protein n=1 Tax=Microvenator marinus TaxID=2600177 RepID=A0A5B8XT49_9DELT|nr:SIR2 family protein [Microvenator marinus]QED26816.1 SIR2 family protein [Microvenator marinus]